MIWGTEYEGNIDIVNILTIKVFIHRVEWVSIQEVLQSMFKMISIIGQFLYMSAGYWTPWSQSNMPPSGIPTE
jgi:hypothetical protein